MSSQGKTEGRRLRTSVLLLEVELKLSNMRLIFERRIESERLREHFNEVIGFKEFPAADVAAGRAYVKAYVEFIHYVERLYEATTTPTHGHFDGTAPDAHRR